MFNWRIFDKKRTILAVQLIDSELRYVFCQGARVFHSGSITLSADVAVGGRLLSAEGLASLVRPHLNGYAGQVAVMLPSDVVHAHMLTLPNGLNQEELDYQATRHITQTLGLSMSDVYYDWSRLGFKKNASEQNILLAVARQSDVAPYAQAFGESWRVRWVTPECFVWANAFPENKLPHVVLRVEYGQLSMWHVDGTGQSHYFSRQFDANMMAQAGFVYQTDGHGGAAAVRLPLRFVIDEASSGIMRWVGADGLRHLGVVYGLGGGVDWSLARSQLQQKLGLPVRVVTENKVVGFDKDDDVDCVGGLWHLAQQLQTSTQRSLNLWPVGAHERVDSRRQLLLESVFAGLLVVFSIMAVSTWFSWRTAQVRAVNAELTQAQQLLQDKKEGGEAGLYDAEQIKLQNEWRAQRSGQLNWLVALAQASSKEVKFTSVKQSSTGLTIAGQANDPETIKNAMSLFASKMNHYKLLKLTLLESKKSGSTTLKKRVEQSQWLFGAELGLGGAATGASVSGAEAAAGAATDGAVGAAVVEPDLKDGK